MLAIMLIVGRPDPPARPAATTAPVQAPSADRVRDYQDRLRLLDAQAMRDSQLATPAPNVQQAPYDDSQAPPPQDPIATDRKRREYESLFASNVVLSRRPENERPDVGRSTSQSTAPGRADGASPSVDEVADAVVRATTRTAGLTSNSASQILQQAPTPLPPSPLSSESAEFPTKRHRLARRDPASSAGRNRYRHRSDESIGWLERLAGELSRDQCALLAYGPAGAHPRRRTHSRRNEACPSLWRNAARRVLPPPVNAGRPHLPPRPVPRTQSDRRRRPPRQGEPSLLVHVWSRGGGRTDQRPVP